VRLSVFRLAEGDNIMVRMKTSSVQVCELASILAKYRGFGEVVKSHRSVQVCDLREKRLDHGPSQGSSSR
jgi:hypothetical protein